MDQNQKCVYVCNLLVSSSETDQNQICTREDTIRLHSSGTEDVAARKPSSSESMGDREFHTHTRHCTMIHVPAQESISRVNVLVREELASSQ